MSFRFFNIFSQLSADVEIFRGSFTSLTIRLCGAVLTFLLHIFIARLVGVEEFGIFVLAINFTNIFLVLTLLGLNQVRLRYIPDYLNSHNYCYIHGLISFSRRSVLCSSVIASLLLMFASYIFIRPSSVIYYPLLLSALYLPFLSILSLESSGLRAFKKVFSALFPLNIIRPSLAFIIILLLISILPIDLNAFSALLSFTISTFFAIIIYLYVLRSQLKPCSNIPAPRLPYRSWLLTGIHMLFISGFGLLLRHIDVIMIGIIITPSDSGIYYASVRIADFISFGLESVNFIIAPIISQYYFSGNLAELQRRVTYSARIILFLTFPAVLVIILFGSWGLGLFGPDFLTSYPSLAILSVGQLVNALSGSVGYICIMTGNEKASSLVLGLSVIVNIILNYCLIIPFGIIGAALATALTTILWNVSLVIYVFKKIGLNSTPF